MIFKGLRCAGLAALLAGIATACSSPTPAPGDAYVSALVGGGKMCSLGGMETFLALGQMNINSPSTVPSGTGPVTIDCTVSPSGGGYNLKLGAVGGQGGRISVSGHVDAKTGGTVSATFFNQTVGATFTDNSCVLTYQYAGSLVPDSQHVSAGQIFAHIECTNASNSDGTNICDANADFLFQNCAQ